MSPHRKIVPWIIVCLMTFGLVAGAEAKAKPDLLHETLTHGGLGRTYSLYFPNGVLADRPRPLVFVLHGGGGSDAKTMAHRTGLNSIADREGFLVVYPAGIDGQWNDGRGKTFRRAKDNTGVDDVGFISSIIDLLVNEGQADPDRIYVMGLSNGGMMTLRIGIELGAKLAGIASGIANLPVLLSDKRPVQPLSVLMMNGTDDPLVPWEGGAVHILGKDYGEVLSTEQTVQYWVDRAGLPSFPSSRMLPDTTPTDGCRVEVVTYKKEGEPLEVILYAMKGGGHNLPGGNTPDRPRLIGRKCMDINGAEVIWEFFKKHSRATQGDPTTVPMPRH